MTIGVALLYGGLRALEGDITIGVLTAFLLYLRMFFEPMQEISQFFNTFQSASSALEKLSGVLEEGPGVPEPADPVPLSRARGEVRFEDLTFGYVAERPVISSLDLTLAEGETVALVGTTGAGKTTIAKLMARFYDPTSGAVTARRHRPPRPRRHRPAARGGDGDAGELHVRRHGRRQHRLRAAGGNRAEVEDAARAVGAHNFITQLPEGYDTDVAKRGERLSAGQRQLVAFARAFLADPAVLILDEATSSLDIPSERLVQQGAADHPGRPDGGDHRPPAQHRRDRRPGAGRSSTGRSSSTDRRRS